MIDPLIFSKEGPFLTFIHANGYPLIAYQSMLNPLLNKYQVVGYSLRPFWPGSNPADLRDWRDFRDDYLGFLENYLSEYQVSGQHQKRNGLIAVGHSLGAMTSLLAAIQRPDLFQALVLIEPVLFPPWQGRLIRLLSPSKLMGRRHSLIVKTLRRKKSFPDRETMFTNYRGKEIFNRLSDDALLDYVKGISREIPDGSIELSYSPEWEARIYETAGIADKVVWRNLSGITCPVLVIRGINSDTLGEKTMEQLVNKLSAGYSVTISEAGHLAPLEKPDQTSALISEFLDSL